MKRLVLDIETIPITNGAITPEESKKAALDALNGRIVCIGGLILDDFQVKRSIAMVSDDEARLLRWFWSTLKTENIRSFVAHNGLSFDIPFIWRRSVIHGIKPSIQIDLRRYKTDFVYDTMCVWGNWEIKGNVSLDTLSQGLRVGGKSGNGGQVLELWRNEEFGSIAEYCLQDCWLTYACYCRMNFSVPGSPTTVPSEVSIEILSAKTKEQPSVSICTSNAEPFASFQVV